MKDKDEPHQSQPEMERFLREITKPHLVPKTHPKQAEMIATVDEASGELMRRILHHPDFQAVESGWRGLHFLVSRLETDENLKIYLFDISKEELAADLSSAEDLSKTGIFNLLVEQTIKTFGGEPWAVIAGNYLFNQGINDIELLGRMAKIARAAGAPFISSATDTVLGCESLAKSPDPDEWKETEESPAWDALRKIQEAAYLGLALPRFLLRLPYGRDTIPLESFPFQELPGQPVHEQYLWGNPSFACTYLLAQSFIREGWSFQQGQVMDIEGMPLHVYKEQGESVVKPCAEVVLTEKAAEKILDKGLLLLLSYRNQDVIRLARFQSLADPPANLAGKWG
jgi:type VI secretion system protein ImpC